jgi:hypothetical protein
MASRRGLTYSGGTTLISPLISRPSDTSTSGSVKHTSTSNQRPISQTKMHLGALTPSMCRMAGRNPSPPSPLSLPSRSDPPSPRCTSRVAWRPAGSSSSHQGFLRGNGGGGRCSVPPTPDLEGASTTRRHDGCGCAGGVGVSWGKRRRYSSQPPLSRRCLRYPDFPNPDRDGCDHTHRDGMDDISNTRHDAGPRAQRNPSDDTAPVHRQLDALFDGKITSGPWPRRTTSSIRPRPRLRPAVGPSCPRVRVLGSQARKKSVTRF